MSLVSQKEQGERANQLSFGSTDLNASLGPSPFDPPFLEQQCNGEEENMLTLKQAWTSESERSATRLHQLSRFLPLKNEGRATLN